MRIKAIYNESSEAVFVIGHDVDGLQQHNGKMAYFVPEGTFEKVKQFYELFKPQIEELLNTSLKPGTIEYWEQNYHDKIVAFLYSLMRSEGHVVSDISNSLCALGM